MVAFEVLSKICQQHGDELTGSATGTFPQVDSLVIAWVHANRNALVWDWYERAQSSSLAMSAMFAMMYMFYARQDTQDFWQESYTIYVDKLMRAEAEKRKLRRHVCKHKSTSREAL